MKRWMSAAKKANSVLALLCLVLFVCGVFLSANVEGAEPGNEGTAEVNQQRTQQGNARGWAFVAAAFATGVATVGAGIAVGSVGSAAMGAVAERPEIMGKSLIYVALAEGIAIYGLLISILILAKV